MSTKTHKQLCWNCDGYVHVYEIKCPYCGVNLADNKTKVVEEFEEESPSLSEAMQQQSQDFAQNSDFQPPYSHYGADLDSPPESPSKSAESTNVNASDVENPLLSLLLLIPGSVLCLLGLTMLLFSSNGKIVFEFRSKFWFVFLLGSLPLLYAGYRSLRPKKSTAENFEPGEFTNPLEP